MDILSKDKKSIRPEYIVELCPRHLDCEMSLKDIESKLSGHSYKIVAKTKYSILFKDSG